MFSSWPTNSKNYDAITPWLLFVAGIQRFLRSGCDMMMHLFSVIKASFLYGRGGGRGGGGTVSNQTRKAWWPFLKKCNSS